MSFPRAIAETNTPDPANAKRGLIAKWRARRRSRTQRIIDRTLGRREHEMREREKPPRHPMSQTGG